MNDTNWRQNLRYIGYDVRAGITEWLLEVALKISPEGYTDILPRAIIDILAAEYGKSQSRNTEASR